MNRTQKFFLVIEALYVLGDFTAVSIANLFIWQLTKDFSLILTYNAFLFASMAVSSGIASFVAGKISNKYINIISLGFYLLELLLFVILGNAVVEITPIVGAILGIALGMDSYSYTVISQEITVTGNREKFFGTQTSLLSTITLIGVPILTFLAGYFGSYRPVFAIASALILMVLILMFWLKIQEEKSTFHLKQLFSVLKQFPDTRSFIIAKFLFGIQNGLFWVVLGIVTLQFVGNLFLWGIFSSCLTLISIASSFVYGKTITLQTGKYAATAGAYIFAIVTLVLATNWNFVTFVLYQVVLIILNVIISVSFGSFFAGIIEEDAQTTSLRNELNGLGEIATDIGRFLPVFLLILLHISFDNTIYLRIAFVAVAPLPLLVMNALKKIYAFT